MSHDKSIRSFPLTGDDNIAGTPSGTQAVDSPFDLAFGAGEEVVEVEDGWPGEDPGHADGAPADLSGIEFREFHVYEGEGVVNSTMGDDVEALENYTAVEVRDHRGEDQ